MSLWSDNVDGETIEEGRSDGCIGLNTLLNIRLSVVYIPTPTSLGP
jgi:hypothetical protein